MVWYWRYHSVGHIGTRLFVNTSDCIASVGFGKVLCHRHVVRRNRCEVALVIDRSADYDLTVTGGYLRVMNPDQITNHALPGLVSSV